MPDVISNGTKISYEVVGEGRALVLLHGMFGDRSWWTEPGYVDSHSGDFRLVSVDIRGHGSSGKPHDAAAYSYEVLVGDVLAVADAEHLDRFAIWGLSYGGDIAWRAAVTAPERVRAIITTGAWETRPALVSPPSDHKWVKALRGGGATALLERIAAEFGVAFDSEFPQFARAIVLRGDAEAWIAAYEAYISPEADTDWSSEEGLRSFPVPVFLIAGEFEDVDADAAKVASILPRGQSLRLPGLGHAGACLAAELTTSAAGSFLDRWLV
ncbi:MAG TPA: alpha/beta hydrolase [Acidimicrobiia bacterium]